MSLTNAVVKTGATWSPTGGTDLALTSSGRSIKDGLELVVTSDASLLLRRSVELKVSMPSLPPSANAYAKLGRRSLTYRIPFVAADGKLYTQLIRVEASFHAEDSRQNGLISDMAAFFSDSDLSGFWNNLLLN